MRSQLVHLPDLSAQAFPHSLDVLPPALVYIPKSVKWAKQYNEVLREYLLFKFPEVCSGKQTRSPISPTYTMCGLS